ncbi:MAG: tetratricopeptide repeat protein, partial [candidate division Zixibacteria bacterium]|nr:tetratricopeptide repeat protein [candidate division Zixibacteria bacterium]
DARSDLYSLGTVLYEMITGQVPFPGENPAQVLNGIFAESPLPPTTQNSQCTPSLEGVVLRAMSKDVAKRHQSAREFAEDLQREKVALESAEVSRSRSPRPASHSSGANGGRSRLRRYVLPTSLVCAGALIVLLLNPFKFARVTEQQALADRGSIAVMYFENMADPNDPDKLARMVTSLVTTEMSASPGLSVVSRQRLYDIARRLGKTETGILDRSVATDVAREAGVARMITGTILQTSPHYIVTADLTDASTGALLASQRIEGALNEDLFSVVDRLGAGIRQNLGLKAATAPEDSRPLATATTNSPEAYRAYLDGLDLLDQADFLGASTAFRKAVAIDTTFAMAYYQLSRAQRTMMLPSDARKSIEQAAQFSGRLNPREQLYIKSQEALVHGDRLEARATLQELVREYPREIDALMSLALIEYNFMNLKESLRLFQQVLAIDSTWKMAWNMLAYTNNSLGDFEGAISAINRYVALAPDEANPYDSRGDLLAMNGRPQEAVESYRAALERKPDFYASAVKMGHLYLLMQDYARADSAYRILCRSNSSPEYRAQGRTFLAGIAVYQGRLTQAIRLLDQGVAFDSLEQVSGSYLAHKYFVRATVYGYLGKPDSALASAALAAGLLRAANSTGNYFGRADYVRFLSQNGRLAAAQDSLENLRAFIMQRDSSRLDAYWYARGWVDLMLGAVDSARVEFARSAARDMSYCQRFMTARASLESGHLGEAVNEFKHLVSTFDEYRASDPLDAARSYYLLGIAYEKSGWHSEAKAAYQEFLSLWKNADPGLPEVADARARITRMQS